MNGLFFQNYFRFEENCFTTVDAVKNWKKEIDTWATNSGTVNIPIVLFANKADLLKDPLDAFKTGAVMERGRYWYCRYCLYREF